MKLAERISLLAALGDHLRSPDPVWTAVKKHAAEQNAWFLPAFIELAVTNIRNGFLEAEKMKAWADAYALSDEPKQQRTVGVVMAGNIPLVGFHDLLCVFISGHKARIKLSSKDAVLMPYLIDKIHQADSRTVTLIQTEDRISGCDAYIATGSDNSARYFEQYFSAYPHIIRRNRTSVAILDGYETEAELNLLADDIQQYFGLGCRNVTQVFVPEGYDFTPLLNALRKYDYFRESHKYQHNFDYNLTIQIMNNRYYMTNGSVVLTEDPSPFSPISQLHYQYYRDQDNLSVALDREKIQCIVGKGGIPFGMAQSPKLTDYADGVDTLRFLQSL